MYARDLVTCSNLRRHVPSHSALGMRIGMVETGTRVIVLLDGVIPLHIKE